MLLGVPGTLCPPAIFDGITDGAVGWLEEPGPWDLPSVAARVAARVAGPTILFGHSTGGVIAILAARLVQARGLLAGLVVCSSGAHTRGHGDVETVVHRIRTEWGPGFWNDFALRCTADSTPSPLLAGYPAGIAPEAAVAALRSQQQVDVTPLLPTLTVPALVLHGRADKARPLAHAEELARGLPGARLQVLDCGHTPPFERPAEVRAALRARFGLVRGPIVDEDA